MNPTVSVRVSYNGAKLRCEIMSGYDLSQLQCMIGHAIAQAKLSVVAPDTLSVTDSHGWSVLSGAQAITANNSAPLNVVVASLNTENDDEHVHTNATLDAFGALMDKNASINRLFQGIASDDPTTKKYCVDFLRAVVNKKNSGDEY